MRAQIHHRFDRETHSRIQTVTTTLLRRHVRDIWTLVEHHSNSVTDVLVNDTVPKILFDVRHNRFADRDDPTSGFQGINGQIQTVKGTLRQTNGLFGWLPDQKCFGLIAMPSVDDRSDIDVNNVSVFQRVFTWNSMTNYVVNANATTLWKRY